MSFTPEELGGHKRCPLADFLQQDLKGRTMAEVSLFFHNCLDLVMNEVVFRTVGLRTQVVFSHCL